MLLDMEKSLCSLSRRGPTRSRFPGFRAAHSLKGASAYMGFEVLPPHHEWRPLSARSSSTPLHPTHASVPARSVDLISGAWNTSERTERSPPWITPC